MADHEGTKSMAIRSDQRCAAAPGATARRVYDEQYGLELALAKAKYLGLPGESGRPLRAGKIAGKGWRIGAEKLPGHVILLDKTTTGDGIVAGLKFWRRCV